MIRVLDVVISAMGLIVLLPLFGIIMLLIKCDSKGPVIFTQIRFGKHGKPIRIYKFRTMKQNADKMIAGFTANQKAQWEERYKLENDPRVTRFGRLLRKTYLDELPQLINVLRGELSIIGPRPITEEELEKYGDNREKFLSVTPGLTGYWQVYAQNSTSYTERIVMELYYIDHFSFWLNCKIIVATILAIFMGKGK